MSNSTTGPAFNLAHKLFIPDPVQSYIFDYLEKHELSSIKHTSRGGKYFIEHQQPHLSLSYRKLGTLKTYQNLSPLQKLQLEFYKFNDRPIQQRILIVIVCFFLFPVILLWNSPKIIKFLTKAIILPYFMEPLVKYIVIPLYRFSHDYIYVPVFVTLPEIIVEIAQLINRNFILPVFHQIRRAVNFIFNKIIRPVCLFSYHYGVTVPSQNYLKLRQKYGGTLKQRARQLWNHTILPLLRVLWITFARPIGIIRNKLRYFLFISVPSFLNKYLVKPGLYLLGKVWKYVLRPIVSVIYVAWKQMIRPALRWLYVVLYGICVVFTGKIIQQFIVTPALYLYSSIITPITSAVANIFTLVYLHAIMPISLACLALFYQITNFLSLAAQIILESIMIPIWNIFMALSALFTIRK
jgi:hypothetical protein